MFRPLKNDGSDVVLTGGQAEEGLLTAQTPKSFHQLLLLSHRVAQVEGLCNTFEIWGQEEVKSLTQILQVTLCNKEGSGKPTFITT